MKTKLDYYKIFYETAKYSSFSMAAQSLYISQSAISQCIRQLEKDLGCQLFIRSKRGVSLTKEGEILFAKVENAINSIEQGETLLQRFHHLESGSLTIAAGDSITAHYLLPYLVIGNDYKTIPIAVQYLKGGYGSVDMGALMAMLVLSIIPVVVFYLTSQKYIIKGVASGAVKG